jgi:hypothetical protein
MNSKNEYLLSYIGMLIDIKIYINTVERVRKRIGSSIRNRAKREFLEYKENFTKQHIHEVIKPEEPTLIEYDGRSVKDALLPIGKLKIKRENKEMQEVVRKLNAVKVQDYEKEMEKYNQEMDRNNQVSLVLKEKEEEMNSIAAYNASLIDKLLEGRITEAKRLEEAIEGLGIVNPYYYDIGSLCFLYECLDREWTYQLGGPDGAYRMLKQEEDRIELKSTLEEMGNSLDNIRWSLESIRDNQAALLREQSKLGEAVNRIDVNSKSSIEAIRDLSRNIGGDKRLTAESLRGLYIDTGLIALQNSFNGFSRR